MMKTNMLIINILLSIFLMGCCKRDVVFSANKTQDTIEFHFEYKRVDGLLAMQIWNKDSQVLLWDINLNYFVGDKLKYGEVPSGFTTFNGIQNSARQIYPENNQVPESIPIEKKIYVHLDYQFDKFMPCVSDVFYVFKIKADGSIENIGSTPFPANEDWYKQP